jgi:hypothetical protein
MSDNEWRPKVGDKVEVVFNDSLGMRPDCEKELQPGDIIEVCDVLEDEELIAYFVYPDGQQFRNYILWSEVKPVANATKSEKCSCDIISLMNNGCKCGFLEKERANNALEKC